MAFAASGCNASVFTNDLKGDFLVYSRMSRLLLGSSNGPGAPKQSAPLLISSNGVQVEAPLTITGDAFFVAPVIQVNQQSAPPASTPAGLRVGRGATVPPFNIVHHSNALKVGPDDGLQTVATRDDVVQEGALPFFDAAAGKYTHDAEYISMDRSNGFLGVGTSRPQQRLHVAGSAQVDASLQASNLIVSNQLLIPSGSISLGSNTFVVTGSNVGVGRSNPQQRLEVQGSALVTDTLTASNITAASSVTVSSNILFPLSNTGVVFGQHHSRVTDDGAMLRLLCQDGVSVSTGAGGSNSPTLVCSNNMVGVRTSNPSATLDVAGSVRCTSNLVIQGTSANLPIIYTDNATSDTRAGFGVFTDFLSVECTNLANSAKKNIVLAGYGGNVGVGTIAPANFKLDVAGSLKAGNSEGTSVMLGDREIKLRDDAAAKHYSMTNSNGVLSLLDSSASAGFGVAGTSNNTILSAVSGKVGIGINTPNSKLDVAGAVNATSFTGSGALLTSLNATNLASGTAAVSVGGTGTNSLTSSKVLVGNGTGAVLQPTNLHWDNVNTRLGVGIAAPAAALHVFNAGGKKLQFDNDATTNRHIVLYETSNNEHQFYGLGVNSNTLRYQLPHSNGSHVFFAASASNASTELVRITGYGNVGIGVATPQYQLDAAGVISSRSNIVLPTVGTGIQFGTTSNVRIFDDGQQLRVATDDILVLASAASNVVTLRPQGMGVYNSNPQQALDVSGNINFTGTLTQGGVPYVGSQWSSVGSNIFVVGSNVAIGKTTASTTLDVAGGIATSNLDVSGYLRGAGYMTTSVSVFFDGTSNGIKNIATFNGSTPIAANFIISANSSPGGGKTMSKLYLVPVHWLATNSLWQRVLPYGGNKNGTDNEFELQVNSRNSNIAFRALRTSGTASDNVTFTFNCQYPQTNILTVTNNAADALYTDSNAVGLFPNSILSQQRAYLGVGTPTPQYTLDVAGDINFTGLLRQNGSSNVAIGKSNATAALDVVGVIAASDGLVASNANSTALTATSTHALGLSSTIVATHTPGITQNFSAAYTNNGLFVAQASNALRNALSVLSNSTQTGYIRTDGSAFLCGDVGLGTTTPSERLHVASGNALINGTLSLDSAFSYLTLYSCNNNPSSTTTAGIFIKNYWQRERGIYFSDLTNSNSTWMFGARYSGGNVTTRIGLYNSNNTEIISFAQTGSIGVGTTTPSARLHVVNTGGKKLQFDNDATTNRHIVLYENSNDEHQFYGLGANSNMLRYQVGSLTADHVFFAGSSSTASTELLRISGDGYVGIGTSTASNFVQIACSAATNQGSAPDTGSNHGLCFTSPKATAGSTYSMAMGVDYATGYGYINCAGNTSVQALLLNSRGGNVGINVTTPSSTLHVGGTVTATSFSGSGASLTSLNAANVSSGTLAVANGGTGTASLTASKVLVGNGTSAVLQPTNLHWDNVNSRLGVNITAPSTALQVSGTVTATSFSGNGAALTSLNADNVSSGTLAVANGGTGTASLAASKVLVGNGTGNVLQPTNLHWDNANSRLGIGTSTPGYTLDVNGPVLTNNAVYCAAAVGGTYNAMSINNLNVNWQSGAASILQVGANHKAKLEQQFQSYGNVLNIGMTDGTSSNYSTVLGMIKSSTGTTTDVNTHLRFSSGFGNALLWGFNGTFPFWHSCEDYSTNTGGGWLWRFNSNVIFNIHPQNELTGVNVNYPFYVKYATTNTLTTILNTSSSTSSSRALFVSGGNSSTAAIFTVDKYNQYNIMNVNGDGNAKVRGAFTSGGADYAEFFEWSDGNPTDEDRVGMTVVFDVDDKIKPATSIDDADVIIGAVSAVPSVVGNDTWSHWHGAYLKDDFGRPLYDTKTMCIWKDASGVEHSQILEDAPSEFVIPENATQEVMKAERKNPLYDPSVEYIGRSMRKEWTCVGLIGKLRIRKGQPMGRRWIKLQDISETVEEWFIR